MSTTPQTDHAEGIAVIGLAARLPGASDAEQFWNNLHAGVESVRTFTDDELLAAGVSADLLRTPNYVKAGILLDDIELFDARFFGYTPREAELIDPQHRIFLECAWEALENSGYEPDNTPVRVGVFAGAGINNYLVHNLISHPELLRSMNYLQRMMVVEKDYLATRVSYKLNLNGPSFTVQTACSTSLVAVHLACQSLLNGECDIALAGGISIRIPQTAGYLYEQGSTLSPDGHCRAFDANAQGMVTSSGAGIVVLKRLAEALKDRDNVRAVIRSSCINNDGSAKVGFTAPSVDGQATVIAEAQAVAGVTGDQISYVETHGTGTPIGDPIELSALTKAFRKTTDKNGFCPIGSVKTNIGHLDAAAGVTGLIKVVLSLENRELPASLHYTQPNPAIDFNNSPFYVQKALSPWESSNGSRLAGVSSFGIGGTNAHVIVEEAPTLSFERASRPWQVLTMSAKTPEALERATDRLAAFLGGHPSLNLADVAFTLQTGRKDFAYRRAVAVNSIDDAVATLRTRRANRVHTAKAFDAEPTVVFMFPAQGAQHVNMGRDLYVSEAVFREHVDCCAEYLQPLLGLDIRRILFSEGGAEAEKASEQLRQTRFTQPAVFMLNYALARLWMSWGIMPSAAVGHSLGEYVAATLSGVFDLKDALSLVAERARLMQELPAGSMLAVHLSEQELQPWLRDGISLAGLNAPSLSVISGPIDLIDDVSRKLQAKQIEVQPLKTSHAFHSTMMESMIAPFVHQVAKVRRMPPQIPFVSTLTGTWITSEEAIDPEYWGRQIRHGVRFSAAVEELVKSPARVLLEVGPGNTLSTLAKLNLNPGTQAIVVNSLRHAKEERYDQDCVMSALGRLWAAGIAVDWTRVYRDEKCRRVPLPTYPFERKKFWIEARPSAALPGPNGNSTHIGHIGADEIREPEAPSFNPANPNAIESSLYSRPELAAAYVPPEGDTEKKLAKLWEHTLGVRVGIDDDFFELGGHSLMAVTLMGDVENVFGQRLPLASLIQAPTIRQFSKVVGDTHSAAASWSSLVKLGNGLDRAPLFLMHSHGGNVLEYEPLAHRLGKELPLYALQARGLDGNIPDNLCIEEMAAYYLREIRSVQPHGPYYLGGFCFGGFLALEAAQQLRIAGESVAVVLMINSATKHYPIYQPGVSSFRQALYNVRYRHELEWSNVSGKPLRDIFHYGLGRARRLLELAQAKGETLVDSLSARVNRAVDNHSLTYHLERLAAAHDHAWAAYEPKPYDGKVTLFFAKQQPFGICPDPTLGWRSLLTGDFQTIEVPGFRQNMLDEPNVDMLANALLETLRTCDVVESLDRVPA